MNKVISIFLTLIIVGCAHESTITTIETPDSMQESQGCNPDRGCTGGTDTNCDPIGGQSCDGTNSE